MPQKKRGQTPVEEAVARILNALDVPEKTEEIPLLQALGRVAAGDVCARVAQPPFDRSALDGYALRAADIAAAGPETPVTLPVSRYLCAGSDPGGPLAPGTAARIMTGAPVPAGADCVLRQEDTESNGQTVTFHAPVEARANVCFAGEDIAPGKCLVSAGTRLDEVTLGLLAGQGVQTVTVYAKPRAALMPTGDELCSPETPLRPGKIYDSNGPMLAARMLRLGAEPTLLAAGPDDPAALAGKLARLLAEYPLVITTGGVSVGDRDYLPQAAEEAGAKLLFYGIDAKPGTPALAAGKDGHVLLCLSGNPFASFATFELLARPALAKLQGADPAPVRVRAALANGFGKPSPLRRFVRATLMGGVVTLPKGGHFSGGIGALAGCNCLVDVPAGSRALNAGDEVEVILLWGLRVAVIKHDGHDFPPDVPGTDSFRMRQAGADGVAVYSGHQWMVVRPQPGSLEALIGQFADCDLVLLEGQKASPYPKIELVRGAVSQESVCAPETLLALATDTPARVDGVETIGLEDYARAAGILLHAMRR